LIIKKIYVKDDQIDVPDPTIVPSGGHVVPVTVGKGIVELSIGFKTLVILIMFVQATLR